jgi:hypothetical protein
MDVRIPAAASPRRRARWSRATATKAARSPRFTAVEVRPHATDPTSLDLQRRFAAAVPAVVMGKRVDEVNVGRLAGSSGTPKGFNAAIRQIKQKAADRSSGK